MKYLSFLLALLFLFPITSIAATVAAEQTLDISEAAPGNAYLAGMNVRITAPITGDVAALGTSLLVVAPVRGDALLFGGTIEADGPVDGDLRAIGARVTINGTATGDIFAVGGSVRIKGKGADLRVAGINVAAEGGADGPAEIYGVNVTLGGEYAGDVRVFASDHVTVLPGTHISGTLEYDAPQQTDLPADATVTGGVIYTGSSSFLPTSQEAKTFALAGAGLFIIVRIIAGMVTAGLAAGLFPKFSQVVADRALVRSPRRVILLALLGFAVFVATPILTALLALSFVGIGIALILGLFYLLLLLVSFTYAGVLVGGLIARWLKKKTISWRSALLGMLILQLLGLIPILGAVIVVVLTATAAGAIIATAYPFAFGRDAGDL